MASMIIPAYIISIYKGNNLNKKKLMVKKIKKYKDYELMSLDVNLIKSHHHPPNPPAMEVQGGREVVAYNIFLFIKHNKLIILLQVIISTARMIIPVNIY